MRVASRWQSWRPASAGPTIGRGVLLFAAVLLAYWPAIHGAFLFDDDAMVIGSALVKASDGLRRMWFTTEALDYWPLTNSSLWIEWRLWGDDPTGYHVTNVMLHAGSALVLWRILRQLSIPGAWIAAMLFALHPVNVQSVAWIAQRKNTLALLWFLLAILWFVRCAGRLKPAPTTARRGVGAGFRPPAHTRKWYWLSLAAFLLAMLSKGSVAILPGILVLLIWWTQGRVTRRDLVKVAPYLVIAVAFTVLNIWLQRRMPGGERDVTFLERVLGAGGVVWFYLGKALAPINQAFIYPQWNVSQSDPIWWLPTPAAVAATAVLWWKRHIPAARAILFAWAFFCIALLPVVGLTDTYFMSYSLVADHYQYIAMIAIAALVGAGLSLPGLGRLQPGPTSRAVRGLAFVLIAVLGFQTWKQAHLYASGETLYRASLEANPDAWPLRNNLGAILLERDSNEEALQHLREVLRLSPDSRQAHNNMCEALARLRRMDEAIVECRRAIQIAPEHSVSHYNLGLALAARGEVTQARAEFEAALRLDPASVQARSYLAELLLAAGNPAAAAANYREVLRQRPSSAPARVGLARALAELGDPAGAEAALREAIALDPSVAEPHRDLADVLLALGRVDEAVTEYRLALVRDSRSPEAHNNLGVALARAGRTAEALAEFQAALNLDPSFTPARENLEKVSRRR